VTPEEVEKQIGDLEVAVDRLRSLYDQYFMGFEKLEPGVPRKDVDRRIYVLRKEQIRNTAQRFRFQMLLQRYNTYQSHWQRICREIDNGTYKRHLARAEKRFAPEALAKARANVGPQPGAPVTDPDIARALAELDLEFAPPPSHASVGTGPPNARHAPPRKPTTPLPPARAPIALAAKPPPPLPAAAATPAKPAAPTPAKPAGAVPPPVPKPQAPSPPPPPRPVGQPPPLRRK
jgi:hypothetical protein